MIRISMHQNRRHTDYHCSLSHWLLHPFIPTGILIETRFLVGSYKKWWAEWMEVKVIEK
jgi:hypothetical protein